jgi:hypothetical protein
MIPIEPFRSVVMDIIRARALPMMDEWGVYLGARAKIKPDTIYSLFSRNEIDFDVADRILCALGDPVSVWRGPLEEQYLAADIGKQVRRLQPVGHTEGVRVCARVGCSNQVERSRTENRTGPNKKIYCSSRCRITQNKRNRQPSIVSNVERALACPAGHTRTSKNTYVDPQGRRHCKLCRSVTQQRSRRLNRAA